MRNVGHLTVSTPTDRDIVMTRVFNAPKNFVFDAHTKPELLRKWFGTMGGWELIVCEVDLRVGGRYRYQWRGPDGSSMGISGVYKEVVPNQKVVASEKFDEAWYAGDATSSIELTEQGGRTTLRMTVQYASKEVRDQVLKSPMEQGVSASYDMLATLLEKP